MSDSRTRNWAFIGYPGESLPADYVNILNGFRLQWCESPVHDSDVNALGDEKKKHIHFFLAFPGKKSFDQIKRISDSVNGTLPIAVENPRGMVRYFIHADNPEKFQYSVDDLKCYGGLDVSDYFKLGQSATRKLIKEIIGYVEEYNVNTFKDLVSICYLQGYDDWLDCITQKNTMFFSAYMRDRFYIWQAQQKNSSSEVNL